MAIPASEIVSVNPRLIKSGGTDLAINGLLFTESNLIPTTEIALVFSSADDVADYFGANSTEYNAASKYFMGYNNSFAKPTDLVIARRVKESTQAWLRGGAVSASLAEFKAVSDGSLSMIIDGKELTVTAISLTGATSYSDVGAQIQAKINEKEGFDGVTVSFSSLNESFTVTSPTYGSESSITYAANAPSGVDLASMMKLTKSTGAVISEGSDIMSVAENFKKIRAITDNWVCFTTTWKAEADEAVELATWASEKGVDYLYVCWSDDVNIMGTADSVATALEKANVGATACVFGTLAHAVFIMSCAASINWNRMNGTINFAFKSQDGLPDTVDGATDSEKLLSRKWSYYGTHATRNDQFSFLYDGKILGDYSYIDPYVNAVWFKNVLQVAIMNGLTSAGRVPYNDLGYTLVRAWCMDPINRAMYNGVINTGVTVSESQKAQLIQETGEDIAEELFTNGYYIQVKEPSAAIRATRESPDVYLYYTYGGSINKITVASTMLV